MILQRLLNLLGGEANERLDIATRADRIADIAKRERIVTPLAKEIAIDHALQSIANRDRDQRDDHRRRDQHRLTRHAGELHERGSETCDEQRVKRENHCRQNGVENRAADDDVDVHQPVFQNRECE